MQNNPIAYPREPIDVDIRVGLLLKARRIEVGLSQSEVAKRLGITFQQVQKYENGSNRISVGRLWMISELLEVKINYFFQCEATVNNEDNNFLQELLNNTDAMLLIKNFLKIRNSENRQIICKIAKNLSINSSENLEIQQ